MNYLIDRQFDPHPMNEIQVAYTKDIREHAKELAELILHGCIDGREKSLALTKLEECVMWAVKSVATEELKEASNE